MEGQKFNNGKLPMHIVICRQFPDALKAIALCTEYGHQKYIETDQDYLNFKNVKGGAQAYADALMRHAMEGGVDEESGLPHAWHKAWNALAELQLRIEDINKYENLITSEERAKIEETGEKEKLNEPWDVRSDQNLK
jgi:hypothetical protein